MNARRKLLLLMNYWPPFLGAAIKVAHIAPDWSHIRVHLKARPWNRNYVGTHYGGSIYSMTDSFYMLMLIESLGREYIVWDKEATVRYRKPGRGTLTADFRIDAAELDRIREALKTEPKVEPVYTVEVKDAEGQVIAEVDKTLYIRRKDRPKREG